MHTPHFVHSDKSTEFILYTCKKSLTFHREHGIKRLLGVYICTHDLRSTHTHGCKCKPNRFYILLKGRN